MRRGEPDLRVRRERHPGDPVNSGTRVSSGTARRRKDEHIVACADELLDGVPQARDHPIGRRQERLGEKCYPQRASCSPLCEPYL